MQSIHEIVPLRRLFDVLYLLQVLVHVLRVNVRHIKFVQVVHLFYNYSNLILFTYVHCLTIVVVVFLIVVRRFHRQRET